jgi:spore coat polysaccharide biosynthesis protein SpsF (cytidylyltransferase family)
MSFVVAVLQARTSSTRLPGKVMLPLLGVPMLTRQIERMHQAQSLNEIIVATSTEPDDDIIAVECEGAGASCSRGALDDVLDRVYRAIEPTPATVVVRTTGDCPLICPEIIDAVVAFRERGEFDYASNSLGGSFPDGLDVEAMTRDSLAAAWQRAVLPSEREHVTPYIWKHPELFRVGSYRSSIDYSAHRWTVDEPSDYALVSAIFERLYPANPRFRMADILRLLQFEPGLAQLNAGIGRNEGYQKSLESDKKLMGAASSDYER